MLAVQCVQIRAVKFYNARAALGQTISLGYMRSIMHLYLDNKGQTDRSVSVFYIF